MGLTESNQSRSSFWGPSKSKSAQFPEGIYEGKPRQAVTLPSRPIARNLNRTVTSTDDCSLSIVNSRPPDIIKQKDHLLYVSDRDLYNCSRSVQYTKHPEQVIGFSNIKLAPNLKNNESQLDNDSIATQPRNRSRNISCPMKVSLSEASLINEDRDNNVYVSKRVRSRSHNYRKRDSSSSSRKSSNNGITLEEKETQTFPQAPHFANEYESKRERQAVHTQRRSASCKENKNAPNGRRSRKNGKRIAGNLSCSVPATPSTIESDPYIYLHYENNPSQDNGYEEVKSATAWRPGFSEACLYIPKKDENLNATETRVPKRKKSQIIIQLDNKNANHLDNLDSKINNGAYKVCSNVWFESYTNDEGKKYFNGGNATEDKSYNETCEFKNNFSVAGADHADNEINNRNKINRNNISKYNADKESQCNADKDLEEKSALNIIVGNSPFGIQSFKFKQCANLSNKKIGDVEILNSSSHSQINNNECDSQAKMDLMLDNLNALSLGHEKSKEALKVSDSFSPDYETKNSLSEELPTSNIKLTDVSLNETASKKNNAMRSKSVREIVNHSDEEHSMNKNDMNIKPKYQFYSMPKDTPTHIYSQVAGPFKSRTLPSHSVLSNFNFEGDGTYVESQGGDINKNKTKTSYVIDTFPVLRLPKPETQPKLVDVLRKENVKYAKDIKRASSMNSLDTQSGSLKCFFHDDAILISEESDLGSSNRNDSQPEGITAGVYNKCMLDTAGNKRNMNQTCAPDNDKSNINILNTDPSPCGGCVHKTIPIRKDRNYRQKIRRFFSLRVKPVEETKSNKDCSLMCHEQCQGVVSLDCKMDSPDTDLQFHDAEPHVEDEDYNLDFFPLEDNENPVIGNESYESLETIRCVDDVHVENEHDVEEGEEEKHEEEMLEKEIIFEQEMSSMKKQEVSTLRRTVRRIQSQAVDSAKIEEWVQKCPANNVGLQITKEEDGGYRGCLRIHLNLSRPINIVTGTRPPSIYDILQEERTLEKTLTSFYMPRDIVKAIHITSKTTTREVIVALLRKFKVVDNPHKFALYERTYDTGQSIKAKLRRLSDSECPLVLAIAWNAQDITNKRLVLQENDTADIQWDAFSLPELDNFLRILDREEGEYKNQIRDKYSLLRYRIQLQLSRMNT